MADHKLHPHAAMANLQAARYNAQSLDELRQGVVSVLGPFPVLFERPAGYDPGDGGPGIVFTAVVEIPGADERPGPFLGGQMMGYVPAAKGRVADGTMLTGIGVLKTPAWDTHTQPVEVEKPYDPDAPAG